MNWSANPDEFERRFRSIVERYAFHHVEEVRRLREGHYTALGVDSTDPIANDENLFKSTKSAELKLLEEQVCIFLLTATLRTLNWALMATMRCRCLFRRSSERLR